MSSHPTGLSRFRKSTAPTRHQHIFEVACDAPQAYKRLSVALAAENARLETHNPPLGGLFSVGSKSPWTSFGLRVSYRGEFSLRRETDDATRVEIRVRPRLRIQRNLRIILPALVAAVAAGVFVSPWATGLMFGLYIALIWTLLISKPSARLEAISRRLGRSLADQTALPEEEEAEAQSVVTPLHPTAPQAQKPVIVPGTPARSRKRKSRQASRARA